MIIHKYLSEKKWEIYKKQLSVISYKELKEILIKGRYPNNNTFPPLYGIKRGYKYTDLRTVYLCPKTTYEARRYVIPGKQEYENLVNSIIKCWDKHDSRVYFPKSKSIKELILSNKKILPISSSFLRKELHSKPLTKIYHDSIDKWKRFTQRYLYEDSINFSHLLEIDIKEFYKRIYVHSVTWALCGEKEIIKSFRKTNSKAYRKLNCVKLENALMDLHDRQTNGIPIGSLGSDVIAEIIMCKIIYNVESATNKEFLGIRFKDDIKILCESKDDAHEILDLFITELNEYDLDINGEKTTITEDFSKITTSVWYKKLLTLPMFTINQDKKPTKEEIIKLDNEFMAMLLNMRELISPTEGNFWFEFQKRYSKVYKYLVSKNAESKGRLIVWFLNMLRVYPQHTGILLNIIISLISSNDRKYLNLIREKGKQLSKMKNFDFITIWIIYFLGERYLSKKHSKKLHKAFDELKTDIKMIANEDIKRESINLLEFIEKNRKVLKGKKPITGFFTRNFAAYDYE